MAGPETMAARNAVVMATPQRMAQWTIAVGQVIDIKKCGVCNGASNNSGVYCTSSSRGLLRFERLSQDNHVDATRGICS